MFVYVLMLQACAHVHFLFHHHVKMASTTDQSSTEKNPEMSTEPEFQQIKTKSRKRKHQPDKSGMESDQMDTTDVPVAPKRPHFPPISGDKLTVRYINFPLYDCVRDVYRCYVFVLV